MLFALSRCGERDVTLALELDLAAQAFLVAFHRQEHVGLHVDTLLGGLGGEDQAA